MAFNLSSYIYSICPQKHITLPAICTDFLWNLVDTVEGDYGEVSKIWRQSDLEFEL